MSNAMIHLAMIGTTEWMIILGVVVLIFGGRKLPELARAMGTSITEFKKGLKSDDGEGKPRLKDKSRTGADDDTDGDRA